MSCEFEHFDCKHIGTSQCNNCYTGERYVPKKQKTGIKKTYAKESKRMGSTFEMNNHKAVKKTVDAVSTDMTPNSGAGKVKGDQQIVGIVNISEECKTQQPNRARGTKTFTIHREWLDKLERESRAAKREFWYLKFAFADTDTESFTIINSNQMNDMVATMIHDRLEAKKADEQIDLANKRATLADSESKKLFAEVEYLRALLKANNIKVDR